MSRDKKVSDGRITFVLARGIGEAYLDATVDLDEVRAPLTSALNDADQLARENDSAAVAGHATLGSRSEEHTSELQSPTRISHAVFCLKKTKSHKPNTQT